MQKKLFPQSVLLLFLTLAGASLGAAEALVSEERLADWEQRQSQAMLLQREGAAAKADADMAFEQAEIECHKKFLVNSCLIDARRVYNQSRTAALRVENEGKAIERQIRKEQLNERDQQRAAEAPQRAAELSARESETAAQRQLVADEQARLALDKERKAAVGAKSKAESAERLAKKQAQHEARLAAAREKAARRASQAEAKAKK